MFCPACGSDNPPGVRFCSKCGAVLGDPVPAYQNQVPAPGYGPQAGYPPQPGYAPQPGYGPPAGYPVGVAIAPANSRGYAGFWLRVAAYFVDSIIIAPIFLIVVGIAVFGVAAAGGTARLQGGNPDEIAGIVTAIGPLVFVAIWVVLIVPMWLYWAYMESSRHQGTLGKLAVGLKVTDLNGNPISFGKASGRFFAKLVSGLIPFGLAYMMAGFTQRKQALHDIIAGCLVLRK